MVASCVDYDQVVTVFLKGEGYRGDYRILGILEVYADNATTSAGDLVHKT